MKTITLNVPDMHCAACSTRVEKVLRELPGVSSAVVNLATLRATIKYEESMVDPDRMLQAVLDAGYSPELIKESTLIRATFAVEGMT